MKKKPYQYVVCLYFFGLSKQKRKVHVVVLTFLCCENFFQLVFFGELAVHPVRAKTRCLFTNFSPKFGNIDHLIFITFLRTWWLCYKSRFSFLPIASVIVTAVHFRKYGHVTFILQNTGFNFVWLIIEHIVSTYLAKANKKNLLQY